MKELHPKTLKKKFVLSLTSVFMSLKENTSNNFCNKLHISQSVIGCVWYDWIYFVSTSYEHTKYHNCQNVYDTGPT